MNIASSNAMLNVSFTCSRVLLRANSTKPARKQTQQLLPPKPKSMHTSSLLNSLSTMPRPAQPQPITMPRTKPTMRTIMPRRRCRRRSRAGERGSAVGSATESRKLRTRRAKELSRWLRALERLRKVRQRLRRRLKSGREQWPRPDKYNLRLRLAFRTPVN